MEWQIDVMYEQMVRVSVEPTPNSSLADSDRATENKRWMGGKLFIVWWAPKIGGNLTLDDIRLSIISLEWLTPFSHTSKRSLRCLWRHDFVIRQNSLLFIIAKSETVDREMSSRRRRSRGDATRRWFTHLNGKCCAACAAINQSENRENASNGARGEEMDIPVRHVRSTFARWNFGCSCFVDQLLIHSSRSVS